MTDRPQPASRPDGAARPRGPRILPALLTITALAVAACGGDGGSGDGNGGGRDAGADGSDGGGGGGDTGGTELPWPADPGEAIPVEGLDGTRRLSDLTNVEIERLCIAQERFYDDLDVPIREYLCLADSVDYGQVGSDPALTCDRFRGTCQQMIDLSEQFPDIDVEPSTEFCRFILERRRAPVCTDPTVDAYRGCLLDNLAQQLPNIGLAEQTCEELTPLVSIRPTTLNDCACGTPDRIGPAPANDADWDYVPDDTDVCPGSEWYYPVDDWGCHDYQDSDGDHVYDPDDLCGETEADAPEVSPSGCSRAQDGDFDDVPDAWDPCPETPEGAELVTLGCALSQDEDRDGVPNRSDWCPFTDEALAATTVAGCSPDQGQPWRDPYRDDVPEGFEPIVIGAPEDGGAGGPDARPRLYYASTGVTNRDADGFDFDGTLLLDLGDNGYMLMPGSLIHFNSPEELAGEQAMSITGSVNLPVPAVGILQGLRVDPIASCTLGYALGDAEVFVSRGLPVEADRGYLYVVCTSALSATLGQVRLTTPQNVDLLMALDPADPALFLRGDIDGMGALSRVDDVAFGVSSTGRLSYEPAETWEVDDVATPFAGHMLIQGSVPIETWLSTDVSSFSLDGSLIVDIDPEDNGLPSLNSADLAFGGNGALSMTLQLFSVKIRTHLGDASAGGLLGRTNTIWASGRVGPSDIVFPTVIPLAPVAEARVAVVVSDQPETSRLVAEGFFRFRGSELSLPLIPEMYDFEVAGRLEMDHEGVRITGSVSADLHPWVQVSGGGVEIEIYLAWDRSLFYFDLSGELIVLDQRVSTIHLGSDDLIVDGDALFFLDL
jgi:hypothetical protein